MISPLSLMTDIASMETKTDPGSTWLLRSMSEPFSHRNTWRVVPWQSVDLPITCPLELISNPALQGSPPTVRVPRSVMTPRCQMNAWLVRSPVRSEKPTTWPRLFTAFASPIVPPSVPRSIIRRFTQRKGSMVGMPVVGLGAGNQQVHAPTSVTMTTSGWEPACNDFPSTVNFDRLVQIHARVSWNQGVQIDHRSAVFPQESLQV